MPYKRLSDHPFPHLDSTKAIASLKDKLRKEKLRRRETDRLNDTKKEEGTK